MLAKGSAERLYQGFNHSHQGFPRGLGSARSRLPTGKGCSSTGQRIPAVDRRRVALESARRRVTVITNTGRGGATVGRSAEEGQVSRGVGDLEISPSPTGAGMGYSSHERWRRGATVSRYTRGGEVR